MSRWMDGTRELVGKHKRYNNEIEIRKLLGRIDEILKDPETLASEELRTQLGDLQKELDERGIDPGNKLSKLKTKARLLLGSVKPEGEKVRRAVIESSQTKPVYEHRKKEVEAALQKLQSMPGTGVQQKQLTQLLQSAAKCIPDYKKALGKLYARTDEGHKYDPLGALVSGAEDSKTLAARVFPDRPNGHAARYLGMAQRQLDRYSELAQHSDSETVGKYRDKLQEILKQADKARSEKKTDYDIEAGKKLDKLYDDIKLLVDGKEKEKKSMEDFKRSFAKEWDKLEDKTALMVEKEQAESLEGGQFYEEAGGAYEELIVRIKDIVRNGGPDQRQNPLANEPKINTLRVVIDESEEEGEGEQPEPEKPDAKTEKAKKGAATAIKALKKKMDELTMVDGYPNTGYDSALEKIRELNEAATTAEDWKQVKRQAEETTLQIETKNIQVAMEKRKKIADDALKLLNGKIDRMEKENPGYQKYFATQRTNIAIMAAKTRSSAGKISGSGEKELINIKREIQSWNVDYTPVETKKNELQARLSAIQKKDQATYAGLKEEWKELLKSIGSQDPASATAALSKFETEQIKPKEELVKQLGQFRVKASAIKFQLEHRTQPGGNAPDLKDTAPELLRALKAQRKIAKNGAGASLASLHFAAAQLEVIQSQLDLAKSNPDYAKKANAEAEDEEFVNQRRKAEYQAAKDVFLLDYERDRATFSDTDKEEIKNYLELADKMAEGTPPDLAGARRHLAAAAEMAKEIVDSAPDKDMPDTSARGRKLRTLNETWKTETAKYRKEIVKLREEILKGAADDGIDAAAVKKVFKQAVSVFNPMAFDVDIDVLAKPGLAMSLIGRALPSSPQDPGVRGRRASKEKLLVRMRRYQDQLKKNEVLKYLATAEAEFAGVKVNSRPLQSTIAALQKEVLGS